MSDRRALGVLFVALAVLLLPVVALRASTDAALVAGAASVLATLWTGVLILRGSRRSFARLRLARFTAAELPPEARFFAGVLVASLLSACMVALVALAVSI